MFAEKTMGIGHEKNYMYFAEVTNVTSVKECAKACWEVKFCKSATYIEKKQTCRLGYAQVTRCSGVKLVDDCPVADAVSVICIACVREGTEANSEAKKEQEPAVVHADLQVVDSCFKAHPYKVLVNASIDVFQGYSIKECLCFCAQTWAPVNGEVGRRCGSVHYNSALRECVLNSAEVALDAQSLMASRNRTDLLYEFTCAGRTRETSDYASTLCPGVVLARAQRPPCLEKLDGYVLNNAAAALIHRISEDECRCHCYQSKARDNYGFDCKSAMYYPTERDCVLNIRNRFYQPNLLSYVGNISSVSYLGLTCSGSDMVKFMEEKCTSRRTIHQPSDVGQSGRSDGSDGDGKATSTIPGENTDQCFVEQPHHVLTGLTAAVESQKTVDECKCLCADGVARYNFTCMSIQYDWNTKVCLLNNANRIQNPKRFYKVTLPEVTVSYFDFICAEQKGRNYSKTKCEQFKSRLLKEDQLRKPKLVLPGDIVESDGESLTLGGRAIQSPPTQSENLMRLKNKGQEEGIDGGLIISGDGLKKLKIFPDSTAASGREGLVVTVDGMTKTQNLNAQVYRVEENDIDDGLVVSEKGLKKLKGSSEPATYFPSDVLSRRVPAANGRAVLILTAHGLSKTDIPVQVEQEYGASQGESLIVGAQGIRKSGDVMDLNQALETDRRGKLVFASPVIRKSTNRMELNQGQAASGRRSFVLSAHEIEVAENSTDLSQQRKSTGHESLTLTAQGVRKQQKQTSVVGVNQAQKLNARKGPFFNTPAMKNSTSVTGVSEVGTAADAVEGLVIFKDRIKKLEISPDSTVVEGNSLALTDPMSNDRVSDDSVLMRFKSPAQDRFGNDDSDGEGLVILGQEKKQPMHSPDDFQIEENRISKGHVFPEPESAKRFTDPVTKLMVTEAKTELVTTTLPPTPVTRPAPETTTVDEYSDVSCSFSALYDAEFKGKLLVPPFTVRSYAACLAECAKRKCRSADLTAFLGQFKQCHLFSDSAIDYRFESPLTYRKGVAYYEGISCTRNGVPL